ncbi:oligoribonuclease [Piscirickettsia litoralis]|uniref:Oligoribonuclease n=1 Tax=Piscirickettsia litoralis TaxID=1891921 RepID=A0ABX3A856_9GAMM|nr:oligoribonuclease [Piscirickettsia litoralis]ODN43911.1 oligoribonuclease [Piscirickettsia litoralis]
MADENKSQNEQAGRMIWIDLEMTGLEVKQDKIIEIATIVTDAELNILAEGPVYAIHQSDAVLENMNEWCIKQHGQSGLTERVRKSDKSTQEAERLTIEFLSQHISKGASAMCGNSVHQDRAFLREYMPELEAFFHYRNIDVSTFKELAQRWNPEILKGLTKESKHLALDDIKDSIDELKYYRQKIWCPVQEEAQEKK